MKSLSPALDGFCVAFFGWYLYGYNQSIYNGDFPAYLEIAVGNLSAGILLLSLVSIIKHAKRDSR